MWSRYLIAALSFTTAGLATAFPALTPQVPDVPASVPCTQPASGRAWPTGSPAAVVRGFDPPRQRWLAGHRGVDLAATPGAAIYSPADGIVSFSGVVANRPVVSVTDRSGLRLTFEPVTGSLPPGTPVAAGTIIGYLEAGHESDAVHWGVRLGEDRYLNPLTYLCGRVRLLPW